MGTNGYSTRPTPEEQRAKQDAFLDAFERVATVVGAAQQANVDRTTHYKWLANDPEYAQRYARAEEAATQRLEQEARRRALVGTPEPVFYQGEQCGEVKRYSDVLLIFLLKARRPAMYRDKYDHNVTVTDTTDLSKLTREEMLNKLDTLRTKLLEEA